MTHLEKTGLNLSGKCLCGAVQCAGDWSFHEALYRPSGHGRRIEIIRGLRTTSDLYAAAHHALPKKRKRWLADHRATVAACRGGRTADALNRTSVSNVVPLCVRHPPSFIKLADEIQSSSLLEL